MNIRREILRAIDNEDFDLVCTCFDENPAMTSRILQMQVYGLPHERTRWVAISYIGKLAGKYSKAQDDLFRNIIRRFIWQMCEESANVPWASAEVIGSIVAEVEGRQFEEFVGPLFYHTGLNDICYPGLFWVLPNLMHYHADKVEEYLPSTYEWFDQYEMADMRAYAALYFEQYPHEEMRSHLAKWQEDAREAQIYADGDIHTVKISELAQKALAKISA